MLCGVPPRLAESAYQLTIMEKEHGDGAIMLRGKSPAGKFTQAPESELL